MQETTLVIGGNNVTRFVCNRGHPHPTSSGAAACESARADGASDVELTALLEAEVAEFNA